MSASASARFHVLHELIDVADDPDHPFVERRHVDAIAWRFQPDHHRMILDRSEWARDQTATWASTTDPGDGDWHRALSDTPVGRDVRRPATIRQGAATFGKSSVSTSPPGQAGRTLVSRSAVRNSRRSSAGMTS